MSVAVEAVRTADVARLVQLRVRPLWRHIDGIRRFCDSFTSASFEDPTLGQRVGLVIHELTENAIKYSRTDDAAELELSIMHDGEHIEIEVVNAPAVENLSGLKTAFDDLGGASAEEAYVAAMRRASTLPDGKSGLGLARIRHDAEVELALSISNDLVRVTAKGKL